MEEHELSLKNTSYCSNCHSSLDSQAVFCQKCGQKNTDNRLTLKELFSHFFDSVFNLDSKIFRTLAAVVVPGKLTNAFLSGQRQKYYHPIRLFLVLIVISLATINYHSDMAMPTNLKKDQIDKLLERKRLVSVLDEEIKSITKKTNQTLVLETLDTLSNNFYRKLGEKVDSININDVMKITDDFDFYIALDDINKYTPEEIVDNYKVKGFVKRLMVQQKIKMLMEGTNFIPFVMGKVTWVVFIVLLLLSIIFKMLYFKSDFLYLEHLIFGIHLNSFFLIVLSILYLFPWEIMQKILPWALIIMVIFSFIAMKRVYKQSYFKTSLKFLVVILCYFVTFVFGFILTMLGSFLIF